MLGNDYKRPVVLAREMATLDLLSDGRLELGIGAGWMTVDYEKAGIPLDRAACASHRLAESITILKGLFAPGPFTFHGEHYQVTELDGMPKPRAARTFPSSSAAGARRFSGWPREAKIVGINANLRSGEGESHDAAQSLIPAATDQKLAWLREAAGDGFDDLEIQSLLGFVHVTDDASGIVKAIAGSFGVSEDDALLAPATLVGSMESIVELLERRRERWQMSYIVVPIEATETLAPVVARRGKVGSHDEAVSIRCADLERRVGVGVARQGPQARRSRLLHAVHARSLRRGARPLPRSRWRPRTPPR